MGFTDIFKVNEYKNTIADLQSKYAELKKEADLKLTVQQMKPVELEKLITEKQTQFESLTNRFDKEQRSLLERSEELKNRKLQLENKLRDVQHKVDVLQKETVDLTEQIEMESYGLYKPKYNFATALEYKDRLTKLRTEQKVMIKDQTAGLIFRPMALDGSNSKGKKMQKKNIKQLLRSFNGECEAAINKVTHSNVERIEQRISKSFEQLNKLNQENGIRLSEKYRELKINELHLAFEYELKKAEEKEALREQRQREREEKAVQKEIADQRKKIDKDLKHFANLKIELEKKLSSTSDLEIIAQLKKDLEELKQKVDKSNSEKSELDYREANATAGYVYIISNIGSFGKNVFKIGVTRRLEPMERIDELGSASVPFKFDVHALIFSYDAYKLEAQLHERFFTNRINKVNRRKEYFHITIEQIEEALKDYSDLTVDFNEVPEANEYRDSLKLDHAI
ncbi:DUF4041 domain-containing protein [Loigolactobacillus coryniformis]|jgi:hypothetical protein|uniref:DUF4041 domain-containing protein n=2 Tax=Loigolactobacillus TaxID=2767889 RepID=A0A5B8TI70_9LACO|nr:DUF4041 domain-containing protein [Loigolactobacillus coryniformis]MCL5457581.1 DUF4041 domain-containing protein [Loigolactobacillus coryniformis]QEA54207.1 DUF4041 domain-containing protein [Loigolactobacillus coryniformis]